MDMVDMVTPSFTCPEANCNKSFLRKEHLNRHMRGHDPIRPFKCKDCEKTFTRSDILRRHYLQHSPSRSAKRTASATIQCRDCCVGCNGSTHCKSCRNSGTVVIPTNVGPQYDCRPSRLSLSPTPNLPPLTAPALQREGQSSLGLQEVGQPSPKLSVCQDKALRDNIQISAQLHAPCNSPKSRSFEFQEKSATSLEMTCPFLLPPPEIASRLPLLQTPYKISEAGPDPIRDLERFLSLDTAECSRLLSVYFSKLHGSLPILDALNFNEAKSPKLLVGAMVAASTYSEGLKYHAKLTSLVINALFSSLLPCVEPHSRVPVRQLDLNLVSLKAAAITVNHLLICDICESSVSIAGQINSLVASQIQQMDLFKASMLYRAQTPFGNRKPDPSVLREEADTVVSAVLQLDTYISAQNNTTDQYW